MSKPGTLELSLTYFEAEGLADLLAVQWGDKAFRDLSERIYQELENE